MHGVSVDDADLVRSAVGYTEVFLIRCAFNSPGVGSAEVNVIEQYCFEQSLFLYIDYAEGICVHPASFELCSGQLKMRKDMGDISILAIGCDTYTSK